MDRRPEIDESVNLEMLPWGMTKADVDAAAASKRRAGLGCSLIPALLLILSLAAYIGNYFAFGKGP